MQVSDNSGAKIVQCIAKSGTQWTIGDIITVAVKKVRPGKVSHRYMRSDASNIDTASVILALDSVTQH